MLGYDDWPYCKFCGLDAENYTNPEWDKEKASKAIEEKWADIPEKWPDGSGENAGLEYWFACCEQCDALLPKEETNHFITFLKG